LRKVVSSVTPVDLPGVEALLLVRGIFSLQKSFKSERRVAMSRIRPVITYSILDRSIILWMFSFDGVNSWGVSNEFTGKFLNCLSFEHASSIFDRCIGGLGAAFGAASPMN